MTGMQLSQREQRFLLIITGNGLRFFSAPLSHPSVQRVKHALIDFSQYKDKPGTSVGARAFVTVLERWLNTNPVHVVINSVCKRDAWSSADWDGTFYEGDKITGPSKIDPQAYVHHDELTVWTPHFYHSFEFGGASDDPLFEICMQQDCHQHSTAQNPFTE